MNRLSALSRRPGWSGIFRAKNVAAGLLLVALFMARSAWPGDGEPACATAPCIQSPTWLGPDDDGEHALAYRRSERPPWYEQVLKRLESRKRPNYRLRQHLLFRRAGQPAFWALVWEHRSGSDNELALYEVEVRSDQDVRLRLVHGLSEHRVEIVTPSGDDVHGDGVPVLFARRASGGTDVTGDDLSIFRLDRVVTDVTPHKLGRVDGVTVVGPGWRHVLLVSDDRWHNLINDCGACGPRPFIVAAWRDWEYVPVCRDHPALYELAAKFLAAEGKKEQGESLEHWLERRMQMTLNLVQSGEIERGREYFSATLAEARRREPRATYMASELAPPERQRYFDELLAIVDDYVAPAVAAARADISCPLMGYLGAMDRSERYERLAQFRYR
jgi:hypothetical protein